MKYGDRLHLGKEPGERHAEAEGADDSLGHDEFRLFTAIIEAEEAKGHKYRPFREIRALHKNSFNKKPDKTRPTPDILSGQSPRQTSDDPFLHYRIRDVL